MSLTFDVASSSKYVLASHGCSPKGGKESTRYFVVPDDIMVVYYNSNGVLSRGDNNIPFTKNLHDYNNELFNSEFDSEFIKSDDPIK